MYDIIIIIYFIVFNFVTVIMFLKYCRNLAKNRNLFILHKAHGNESTMVVTTVGYAKREIHVYRHF